MFVRRCVRVLYVTGDLCCGEAIERLKGSVDVHAGLTIASTSESCAVGTSCRHLPAAHSVTVVAVIRNVPRRLSDSDSLKFTVSICDDHLIVSTCASRSRDEDEVLYPARCLDLVRGVNCFTSQRPRSLECIT